MQTQCQLPFRQFLEDNVVIRPQLLDAPAEIGLDLRDFVVEGIQTSLGRYSSLAGVVVVAKLFFATTQILVRCGQRLVVLFQFRLRAVLQ